MPQPSLPLEVLSGGLNNFTCSWLLQSPLSAALASLVQIMIPLFSAVVRFSSAKSLVGSVALSSLVLGGAPPTCSDTQTSCQNSTAVGNLCCFNAPGGQLLQTQFWDTNPPTGPNDSWTVHGLWWVPRIRDQRHKS